MANLTTIWKDKLNSRQAKNFSKEFTQYYVAWDHPDYGKGERTTNKGFTTLEEATDYAIKIGLEYDLRRHNGKIASLNPELSRYKSGYTPLEKESMIPFVMPCIQMDAGSMPIEIPDIDVENYKKRHGMPTGVRHTFKNYPEKD